MSRTAENPSAKTRKPRKTRKSKKTSKGNGAPKDAGTTNLDTMEVNGQTLVKVDRDQGSPKTIDDVVKKHVDVSSTDEASDTHEGAREAGAVATSDMAEVAVDASTGDTGDTPGPKDNASAGVTSDESAEPSEPSAADSSDETEDGTYPSVEEIAVGHGAVPPMEIDRAKREKPTMGPVGWTDDTPDFRDPDAKPTCLEDLMAIFPIETDPQYYVQVYRKAPKNWGGNNCAGMMRPIRESMTTEDFKWAYGGGDYVLTVYGPPRRGGQLDPRTNRPRPKALTGKVQFTIPYGSAFGVPPNPDAAFEEEEEIDEAVMEEPMLRNHRGPFGRPVTTADASIHKATLEADQVRWAEERREKRELEQRLREAEEEKWRMQQQQGQVVSDQTLRMMEMLEDSRRDRDARQRDRENEEIERRKEAEERYQKAMEEQRKQEREEFQRMQDKPSSAAELAGAITPLIAAVRSKGDDGEAKTLRHQVDMLREQWANEKDRIVEQHKNELERERQRRDEIKSLAENRVKEIQDTLDRRLREKEDDCARRIREVEERAERDVSRAKEDGKTRAEDIKQFYEGRLKDEEKNHRRELEALRVQMDTRITTEKTVYEGRERMLLTDTERARADVTRLESELREKGDIAKQVRDFTATAESLGLSKVDGAEAPADWKQILATAGLNVLQNLPETIREAGQAVAGAKNRGQPPPMYPPQGMPGSAPVQQLPPMSFANEGEDFEGEETWTPEPEYPMAGPMIEPEPVAQQMPPQPAPPAIQPTAAYGAPSAPPPAPSEPPPQKRRALNPKPAPSPAPQPEQPAMEIPNDIILSYKNDFEEAFRQKTPPEAFAQALEQQFGKPMVKQIATILTPERVMKALMSTPEGSRSPLVRGEGQAYLRQILEYIRKAGE